MKRIIKPIPASVHFPPQGCVAYDGHYDFITENDDEPEDDAVYVSALVDGRVVERKGLRKPLQFKHHFAGWEV